MGTLQPQACSLARMKGMSAGRAETGVYRRGALPGVRGVF